MIIIIIIIIIYYFFFFFFIQQILQMCSIALWYKHQLICGWSEIDTYQWITGIKLVFICTDITINKKIVEYVIR